MCWPKGKAERRYAGVTHVEVDDFTEQDAAEVNRLAAEHGIAISGLGYYPNPLCPDADERQRYVQHIEKAIVAASRLRFSCWDRYDAKVSIAPIPRLNEKKACPRAASTVPPVILEKSGFR